MYIWILSRVIHIVLYIDNWFLFLKRRKYNEARISGMLVWNLLKGRNVELGRRSYSVFPEMKWLGLTYAYGHGIQIKVQIPGTIWTKYWQDFDLVKTWVIFGPCNVELSEEVIKEKMWRDESNGKRGKIVILQLWAKIIFLNIKSIFLEW